MQQGTQHVERLASPSSAWSSSPAVVRQPGRSEHGSTVTRGGAKHGNTMAGVGATMLGASMVSWAASRAARERQLAQGLERAVALRGFFPRCATTLGASGSGVAVSWAGWRVAAPGSGAKTGRAHPRGKRVGGWGHEHVMS